MAGDRACQGRRLPVPVASATEVVAKILIVDDSPDLLEALSLGFRLQWPQCQVVVAESGQKALELFPEENPDIILLDIVMPGMGGFEMLRRIRRVSDVPIIMLTVREGEIDKIRALELGADDYVTKPFSTLELAGRIKAVLRRAGNRAPGASGSHFTCGDMTIECASHVVRFRGKVVKLGPTEYRLLCTLARYPNRVLPRWLLLVEVWGDKCQRESTLLKVYIRRLRNKIEDDPTRPRRILTEWGWGYRLAIP